ncbi:MAG: LPS-assembly protein LptD [Deltaproteobacteria bacterium]|nr:LPS-assembly protein LptD [Deltaproteobacteria bacterium]MBI3389593.1 LPS-assembly protein LptD [Deltaproteobacteria bacterium]
MRRALVGWALAAALAGPARAQVLAPSADDAGEVAIDAASLSYDQGTNTVSAHGNVVIRRGDTEIHAEEVRFNRGTNEVVARGAVTVSDPQGTLFADAIALNLDEETGLLDKGTVSSERLHYSLSGDRIEKGVGQSYHIENGKFTACRCDDGPPSWSIAGKEVDVSLRGYGTVRAGTFNILDVPVFYLPRAAFPVNRERQSGFLLPRFSASNRRGFQIFAPFYWAINRSQDLTLAMDLETSARIGAVADYRYAFSRDFHGAISPSYFNEIFKGSNSATVQNRWSVVTEHTNSIGAAQAYADLFFVSDDNFVRDINTFAITRPRETLIRTLPYTTSKVGIVREWDRAALRTQSTFYQDLTGGDDVVLQRAPDSELWAQQIFGDQLLARLNASGSDFQRHSGIDGLRLDVRPEAVVPIHATPAVFGSLRADLRETAYHLFDGTSTDGLNGTQPNQPVSLPTNRSRELVHLTAESGTSFSRVYAFDHFGISKLKHTIEPALDYTFVPGVNQDDLALFDGVDRDNRRSLFTYGVASRLLAKSKPEASDAEAEASDAPTSPPARGEIRELARVALTDSVDTQRRIAPVGGSGAADHFSDVNLAVRVQPSPLLALRAHMDYDTSVSDVSGASVGFRVRGPGRDGNQDGLRLDTRNALGVTYRFVTSGLLRQVESNVQLRLTDTVGLVYAGRVDLESNNFLDNYFGLRLLSQCDCWGFEFAVVDKSNPHELEVRAQFTLVGLGSTGRAQPARLRDYP